MIAAARAGQAGWAERPLRARSESVRRLAQSILAHHEEACAVLSDEMGRSPETCRLPEVAVVGTYVEGAIAVAREALEKKKLKIPRLDFPGKSGVVELVPRGVVAVIAPWNYPLMQLYKSVFPALLAGNAVVLKPSEHTPRTGAWFVERCAEILPEGLVGLVQGDGAMGAALVDAEVDAVVFTGSVPTGRKVAARAAERLLPCSVELGGKDAAIVLADCDLDRTVAGLAYASMHNAGQDCASVERIYVEATIADVFVARLADVVGRVRVAPVPHAEIGPLQNPRQLALVTDQVAEAVRDGAELRCGGAPTGQGWGYQPTVLDRCTPSMRVVHEETFGPVVAVIRVADADEAVRQANESRYGLNGSVWTRDLARGRRLARQLEVGVAHVNNHAWTGASLANAPWTGVKDTGPGVAGSVHAYGTFVRPRALVVDKGGQFEPFWFPVDEAFGAFARALVQRGLGSLGGFVSLVGLLGRRVRAVKAFTAARRDPGGPTSS